ncbi:tumor necrosis factor receptor superfamily member 14 [Microtus ochrogaster]|uniref:Tumor necrosis factor receptor superfamily member 14 n=1 Tax=Microtus ochrogaster TaxID=79684 RepID=A0ABM1UUZ6_MICOH|nr:tumor necrosis factor receptor superfamily member 14 [Microtus ochrogaster]
MEPLPGWESSPWSQAPTANTFRLGLCVFLLNFLSCVAVEPLCKEEEYSVGDHCCPMCNPGYYVKRACSNWTGIVCAPCPPQTYTAHANGLSKCLSCGACDPDMGLVTWRECSSREDTVCRCIPGYFCETQEGDHCSTCNYFQDTVCADCPTGTFSPGGAQEECLPWTKCDAWYLKAEHGTSSTDATCSYSGLFYLVCGSILGVILVIGAIVVFYVIRKRSHTRPAAREVELLQRQEKDNTVKLPVLEVGSAEEETAFNHVSSA